MSKITRISYSDDNEEKRKGLIKRINKETKQNENNFTYLNSRIRKICEKARQNIEMASASTSFEKKNFYYSKSYFVQAMCNKINFFKEDSGQIGRTFGPYTFRGWIKSESNLTRGIFTKVDDCDTYFSKQFNQLLIYDKTEKMYVRVPLSTPYVDNEDFFKTSLDILCDYLKNTGVPKSGDVFGYFTVDFCGLLNSYREYCEKMQLICPQGNHITWIYFTTIFHTDK